jgi:hypothetical protein
VNEPGFHLTGWYHYRRLMLNFLVDADALAARLPAGWHPLERLGGSNLTVGLCEVLLHVDRDGAPVSTPTYYYVPVNGSARNEHSGETANMRYLTLTTRREALADCLTRPVDGSHKSELALDPEGRSVMRERYEFTSSEVRVAVELDYERPQPVLLRLPLPGMRVRCPDGSDYLAIYWNEEVQESVYLPSDGTDLRRRFEYTIEIPELSELFGGKERLASLVSVPMSRREIWLPG